MPLRSAWPPSSGPSFSSTQRQWMARPPARISSIWPVGALFGEQAQYPVAGGLVVRYEAGDRSCDIARGGGEAFRFVARGALVDRRRHQPVAAAEMAQDGALGDPGLGGDHGQRRTRGSRISFAASRIAWRVSANASARRTMRYGRVSVRGARHFAVILHDSK